MTRTAILVSDEHRKATPPPLGPKGPEVVGVYVPYVTPDLPSIAPHLLTPVLASFERFAELLIHLRQPWGENEAKWIVDAQRVVRRDMAALIGDVGTTAPPFERSIDYFPDHGFYSAEVLTERTERLGARGYTVTPEQWQKMQRSPGRRWWRRA